MGVPALFRWLSERYPKIISQVLEEAPVEIDGVEYPADYSRPNPNGELDNLYLDMNGIVHPCTHPEGRPAPETEDQMLLEVFRYTDRVVSMARPRKILMMAVDGVAPRAKMNQQRSRRFRSAQDAKILAEERDRAIADAEARGESIDDAIKGKKAWDTNVITPGTPFMDLLATGLRYWVAYKLNSDPGWKDLKIIISDAWVPGEGEHKIMNFIRSQRTDPGHDPNTSHCIYGLDADLIFLGLATHEPHFRILREDVFAEGPKKRKKPGFGLTELERMQEDLSENVEKAQRKPFIWLHVDILRQYLEVELDVPRLSFAADFERAIDDWIFMCFFVGNDFLPHMPSLDVRENSIDTLLGIWKRSLPSMKGYMTCDGTVNLERVEIMLRGLGAQEDNIFRRKRDGEMRRLQNDKRRKMENEQRRNANNGVPPMALSKNRGERAPIAPMEDMPLYTTSGESVGSTHMTNTELVANRTAITMANMANRTAAQDLKAQLLKGSLPKDTDVTAPSNESGEKEDESRAQGDDEGGEPTPTETEVSTPDTDVVVGYKRKAAEQLQKPNDDFDEPEDNVRLWEPGYRERYYENKFHVDKDDKAFRRQVIQKYIEGVCWTLLYYYQPCPSWNWYYPYHYAPFAQDLVDLADIKVEFNKGEPFRPFEQLMSVLPAASGHTLPEVFRPLMSNPDSEIIDFYPEDFPIDMNGKKMAWQGIALLPFIDETRLLKAVRDVYPQLTERETELNSRKEDIIVLSQQSKLFPVLEEIVQTKEGEREVRCCQSDGLAGTFRPFSKYTLGGKLLYPLKEGKMSDFDPDTSVVLEYHMPELKQPNKSMLLSGVKLSDPVLTFEDKDAIRSGFRRRGRNGRDNRNGTTTDLRPEPVHKGPTRPGGYQYYMASMKNGSNYASQGDHSQGNYNGGYNGASGGYNGGHNGNYNGSGGYDRNRGRGGYQGGYQGRGNRDQGGYQGGQGGYQGGQGGYQGGQGGYQGGQGYQGGYQGRDNQGGYQRNQGYQGSYQSGSYGNNQGGYQGAQGGYQGGYQGQGYQGGYQGSQGGQGGYQGSYQGGGGYQGGQGGYQGGQGGYQGGGNGGYQGGQGGYQGGQGGYGRDRRDGNRR